MPHVDLAFHLTGTKAIPADHGYALYGAISRLLPDVHRENGIAVHPIAGRQVGERRMMLTEASRLTVRVSDQHIAGLLPLAGKQIRLADAAVRVGVPEVRSLTLAPTLRSRLVVIKVSGTDAAALTAEMFATAARKQLDALGVSPKAELHVCKRRTLRIKQREIVGYEVVIECLTAEGSLLLQERGIGGKRHMGCGVFAPIRSRGESE